MNRFQLATGSLADKNPVRLRRLSKPASAGFVSVVVVSTAPIQGFVLKLRRSDRLVHRSLFPEI